MALTSLAGLYKEHFGFVHECLAVVAVEWGDYVLLNAESVSIYAIHIALWPMREDKYDQAACIPMIWKLTLPLQRCLDILWKIQKRLYWTKTTCIPFVAESGRLEQQKLTLPRYSQTSSKDHLYIKTTCL